MAEMAGLTGALCLVIGMMLGRLWATGLYEEKARRTKRPEAPAPVELGFDPMNPMNGGARTAAKRGERVEICGGVFYRM